MKEAIFLTSNQKNSFINKLKLSLGVSRAIFLLMILLLFPIISAIEFNMETEFSQGETLIAKVSGNFLKPISKENIKLYRGHVRVSLDPYVAKINDDFYIYASLLGKEQNNYSLVIEDTKYYKGGQISEEDIVKNFSITNNTADFLVNPGFIITEEDFFIEVQNLKDSEITIQIKINFSGANSGGFFSSLFEDSIGNENNSVTLKSGEIEKINFKLGDIKQSLFETIELSTENTKYEIPVYIIGSDVQEPKQKSFRFEPSELSISMSTNSNTTRIIYLYNTGTESLENISLSFSDSLEKYISLSLNEIDELKENSSVRIELYVSSDDEEKQIEGQLTAEANQTTYSYCAIFLNFIDDYEPPQENDTTPTTKTCLELGGIICENNEECEGEEIYAKDDKCCLGNCKEIEKTSTGKIIGWIIVITLVCFLVWFFKTKYRGTKKDINLLKIAKGKKK